MSRLCHAFPPLDSPQFDGSNPKLWIRKCETFFDIYSVAKHYWVGLATMNFIGSAAFWLQSIQSRSAKLSWEGLGSALCARFDRDERNHMICQFFRINQTTSISDYIETFSDLVHEMLAHDPTIANSIITNRFIDGLRDDIRAIVVVHRPQDLDTASSLALLQEEVLVDYPRKEFKKPDGISYQKRYSTDGTKSGVSSSIASPSRSLHSLPVDDKKSSKPVKPKTMDDKLSALKAYRRAKGLCYKCGEKWNPSHKCLLQFPCILLKKFGCSDSTNTQFDSDDSDVTDDLCALSSQAIHGTEGYKTIRLRGFVSGLEAFILVDFGSTHCFINEQLAATIPRWKMLETPLLVKVANGNLLT